MDLREIPDAPFRRHPWEVARFRFFRSVLDYQHVPLDGARVLDAGAGDSWFLRELVRSERLSRAISWDPGYELGPIDAGPGIDYCTQRPRERLDLVLLLDVLEHVEDDSSLVATLARENLDPGGWLLVSVPAWPFLYGHHDRAMKHHRRYTPMRLRLLLEGGGFEIVRAGGLFHSLVGVRWVQNLVDGRKTNGVAPESLAWRHGRLLERLVDGALGMDTRLSLAALRLGVQLPGLSLWALCRKR